MSIAILSIYVSLSAIQVISIHYCHGHLESINIFNINPNCCDSEHTNHMTCCNDISIEIDFDTDHIYKENLTIEDPALDENLRIDLLDNIKLSTFSQENEQEYQLLFSPPPPKLYLLNTSFVFYG